MRQNAKLAQVEKDEEYIKSVTALGAVIEDLVKANNAVDIYEEYFAGKVCTWANQHSIGSAMPSTSAIHAAMMRDLPKRQMLVTNTAALAWLLEAAVSLRSKSCQHCHEHLLPWYSTLHT